MSLCHRGLQVKLTDTRLTVVVSAIASGNMATKSPTSGPNFNP